MSFPFRAAMFAAILAASSPLLAAGLTSPTPEETQVLDRAMDYQAQMGHEKRAFVDQQLKLSPKQAARFWPVYDAQQVALAELHRRRIENMLSYARVWNAGGVDDLTADELARGAIAIEEDEVTLLKRTYRRASRAVSPAQAARYVQIEAKISARARYVETANMPLVK